MPRPFEVPHLLTRKASPVNKISPYAKAIAGAVAGGLIAYFGAQDGGVNGDEWLQIALAALGGSGLVYLAPKNKAKR